MTDEHPSLGEGIAAADRITAAMDGLAVRFETMARAQRHARRTVRWIAALLLVTMILSYFVYHDAHQASTANRNTLVGNCVTGNQTRVAQTHLWDGILTYVPAGPVKTRIEGLVAVAEAPHDCKPLPDGTLRQPTP